jgi:hypothetical protein
MKHSKYIITEHRSSSTKSHVCHVTGRIWLSSYWLLGVYRHFQQFFQHFHHNYKDIYIGEGFMKRKYKQWWSTIQPISTKLTITSHLNLLNTKKGPQHMMLEIQVLGLGQAQELGVFKPVNGILTSWLLDLQHQYMYKQTIKSLHGFALTWKGPQTITNMNDNINMDSTTVGLMIGIMNW